MRRLSLVTLLALLTGCQTLHQRACKPSATPCKWAGIYPTVLTPFCCDGGVDIESLERQLRHELQGGVHGLLVLGTIGEGEYVDDAERAQVIATAVKVAAGCVPVVVGIHTCDLDLAKSQLLQAKELGASAVLVKYAGNPKASPAQVLTFMSVLSGMHVLPIFYYHYPSQTKLRLSPQDVGDILLLPGVVGIKESTLDLREVQCHIRLACGQGKVFLSGTALNLTQFMKLGGHGAMCPEAVLLPGPVVQAYDAAGAGNWHGARAIQRELFEMLPILRGRSTSVHMTRTVFMAAQDHKVPLPMGGDHPQARLKFALDLFGIATPTEVKPPLPQLSSEDIDTVRKAVTRLQTIDWVDIASQAPPVPLEVPADEGGFLLQTGGILLAPNAGRDLVGWHGDGR
jgi:dihydrodipicolinate synthase/N-acetylneuraminate lyase